MDKFIFPNKEKKTILALGAESAGNFSVFENGQIYMSDDFGDLLEEKNWKKFQSSVLQYLKNNKIKPDIIITDLHPLFKTTILGKKLAKKFGAKFIPVQHHHAHIFSAVGDKMINSKSYKLQAKSYCIAMDGTGFGMDEKIWGGEVFKVKSEKLKVKSIERTGYLENQIMLGGDLAIQEPARMLIGILYKFLNKKNIYNIVKKYYTKNQFELLYNQLKQNFNCIETSSAGRILDAVSVLLGFCKNERKFKHEPINLLEKNSTTPYPDLKSKIDIMENAQISNFQFPISNQFSINKFPKKYQILNTTYLFEYLIKNIKKDKGRLATTAQLYIAEGVYKMIKLKAKSQKPKAVFISGGLANNKIISKYFISQGAYASKNIYPVKSGKIFNGVPLGDAGISFGQIIYYLLS